MLCFYEDKIFTGIIINSKQTWLNVDMRNTQPVFTAKLDAAWKQKY